MSSLILFHHAMGLTTGFQALADRIRQAGHEVHTPDLFEGQTFDSLEAGVGYAQDVGFDRVLQLGVDSASELAAPFVVGGFSLGVMPAQRLAQTDPRVAGAVLVASAVPLGYFGDEWPAGVRLQVHIVEEDPWAADDLPAARDLTAAAGGDLFLYAGSGHLLADASAPDHDPDQAAVMLDRIMSFLGQS